MIKKLCLIIILFSACKNKSDKKKNSLINNTKMNSQTEKFYMLNHDIQYPAEILINDVVAELDLINNPFSPVLLNDYILQEGKQHIKIIAHSLNKSNGGVLNEKSIESLNNELSVHSYELMGEEITNFKQIKKLDFGGKFVNQPIAIEEWTFDASLPFTIKGWSQSEDLSKWDEDKLEEKVVAKFKGLRSLLNSGNGNQFVNQLEKANEEYFIANYWDEKKQAEYLENLANDYSKLEGLVPEIENYRVRIMGGGKAVALEALDKHIGQGILTAEDSENQILYTNYFILHKPKNTDDFEIIRYNSNMDSLE